MGFLDDYDDDEREPPETVEVTVRIEHTTARAYQVSQDRGQTTVWIPRGSVHGQSKRNIGPGDNVRLDVERKIAEEKNLW